MPIAKVNKRETEKFTLLIHGLWCDKNTMKSIDAQLASLGVSTLIHEWPHRETSAVKKLTLEEVEKDLFQVAIEYPINTIIGFSAGGYLAQRLISSISDPRLMILLASAPSPGIKKSFTSDTLAACSKPRYALPLVTRRGTVDLTHQDAVRLLDQTGQYHFVPESPEIVGRFAWPLYGKLLKPVAAIPSGCAVTVIHGTKDNIVPWHASKQLVTRYNLNSSNYTFPHTDHMGVLGSIETRWMIERKIRETGVLKPAHRELVH